MDRHDSCWDEVLVVGTGAFARPGGAQAYRAAITVL